MSIGQLSRQVVEARLVREEQMEKVGARGLSGSGLDWVRV